MELLTRFELVTSSLPTDIGSENSPFRRLMTAFLSEFLQIDEVVCALVPMCHSRCCTFLQASNVFLFIRVSVYDMYFTLNRVIVQVFCSLIAVVTERCYISVEQNTKVFCLKTLYKRKIGKNSA